MKKEQKYRKQFRINGRRVSKYFSRKVDATAWSLKMQHERELLRAGLSKQFEQILMKDFCADWFSRRLSSGKEVSTIQIEMARLRQYILPAFGHRPIQAVRTEEWEQFFHNVGTEFSLKAATMNRIRSLVSAIYSDAIRRRVCGFNPVTTIKRLKEFFREPRHLSSAEANLYIQESQKEAEYYQVLAYLALNTGARVGEILALDWSDIRLDARQIHFWQTLEMVTLKIKERTKGGKGRWVGMNDTLMSALIRYRNVHPEGRLFTLNGKQIDEHLIRRIHNRICKRLGLTQFRFHDLRHTYGSLFVANGGSIYELSQLLGHSTTEMTKKYAHFSPGHLESKANIVEIGAKKSEPNVLNLNHFRDRVSPKWPQSENLK